MPGITGIIGRSSPEAMHAALDQMVKCMVYEPFYTSGVLQNDPLGVAVGWVSHQNAFADCNPIWNETNDICLILTGEVFPDQSELDELRTRGHRFDAGNASSLVHLYEDKGIRFFEALNGWFAGLLVDLREDRLILFNDRFGLSRIYVNESADGVYLSSEAKSLLRVLSAVRQLDPVGLAEYCACGCALQNRSLFAGVSLLPPASAWIFSGGRLQRKETYFRKETWENLPRLSESEFYEKLKTTFSQILPKYLRGQGRVSVSLTGGLDSRMIMAWAKDRQGSLPCHTFGGSYRDCTDVSIARQVAQLCGQRHLVIPVGNEFVCQFPDMARKATYVSDGALDVTGAVELYANRLAREIAPVRITGNYGSEILRRNVAFRPQPLDPALFTPEVVKAGNTAAATYNREIQGRRLSFIAFKQVPWHHHSRLAVEQSQLTMRSPFLDNDLVALGYQTPADLTFSKTFALRLIAEGYPALSRIPTDRGVMYRSTPILTSLRHSYQEFTFKAEYAYDYGMPQWLARLDHVLSPLRLERVFLGHHKFYHFRVWYRDKLGPYLKEILLDPRTLNRSHLLGSHIEKLVTNHVSGVRNYTSLLHQALSIELIYRELIERG